MTAAEAQQIDQWAGFSHKASMIKGSIHGASLPSWVAEVDKRRLLGYITASGYRENVARNFLSDEAGDVKKIWREFGDAAAMSDRISDATLGEDITLLVLGADDHLPSEPVFDDEPEPLEAGASGVAGRAHAARQKVYEVTAVLAIERWESARLLQPSLKERQEWLRAWARRQRFEAKIREAEIELTTPLGDSVVILSVEPGKEPTIAIWEPDAYHPVFPDGEVVEFPDKVHMAYEYETEEDGETKKWLRRITYEVAEKTREGSGETMSTTYPYLGLDGRPVVSDLACFMSDGKWRLDGSQNGKTGKRLSGLDDLSDDNAIWEITVRDGVEVEIRDLDLGIHYMPVYHMPADLATLTHFGRSVYVRMAQLFDEIAQNDTDTGRAADLTGQPVFALEEGRLDEVDGSVSYHPGSVFEGKLTKMEMHQELSALVDRGKNLGKRLSSVAAVPEGILGGMQANQIATGISILLQFTPFRQVVTRRRLARQPKLDLILRGVQRLAIVSGALTDKAVYDATVKFGAYIPTDRNALVEIIGALADRGLMTEELAFTMLEAAGMEVGDIEYLVSELKARRLDDAAALVDIAGRQYARSYLGIDEAEIGDDPDYGEKASPGMVDTESQEPDGATVPPVS